MVTRSIFVFALIALLLAGLAVAQSSGKAQSFTGVVSDDMCGAKHTMMPGKPDAECVRACVKAGAKYALVSGGHVYILQGQPTELDKLAAQKVKISGKLNGNTIEVASVVPAK